MPNGMGAEMALMCRDCGGPATAGEIPWDKGRGQCLGCGSVARLDIPASWERRAPVPVEIAQGPAWRMTGEAGAGGHLWLHQAEALEALDRGENAVVANSTASGKSMVFQAWTLHGIKANPEPTTLVFYPTKALANDQERRWLEACELVGLSPETVGKINGDVGVNRRDPIISRARVVIMTPDVCHAWMTRRADSQVEADDVRGYHCESGSCPSITTTVCRKKTADASCLNPSQLPWEVQGNDFNLNISRYVDTTEPVEVMSVEEALAQLREAERRRDEAVARMDQLLAEMGFSR